MLTRMEHMTMIKTLTAIFLVALILGGCSASCSGVGVGGSVGVGNGVSIGVGTRI